MIFCYFLYSNSCCNKYASNEEKNELSNLLCRTCTLDNCSMKAINKLYCPEMYFCSYFLFFNSSCYIDATNEYMNELSNFLCKTCTLDNWSVKAIRRKTTGSGRMRYLRNVPRRFKTNFREG